METPYSDVPEDQKHSPVGDEAALDTQFLPSLGMGVSMQVWYTDGTQPGNPENEPFVTWLGNLANTSDEQAPWLFSISYGDEEDGVTERYVRRAGHLAAAAAADDRRSSRFTPR